MKQKKAIVFFSAGIGDAVLLIPLIKQLKSKGFWVCGLFNSKQPCEEIFKEIDLLDELIICKSRSNQLKHSLKMFFKYDKAYINYFAANRINLLAAAICSKRIFINRKLNSVLFKLFSFKVNYIEPVKNIHDAQQNINLLDDTALVSLSDFQIKLPEKQNQIFPYQFIAVQISAANNDQTYKNWPANHWVNFLKNLKEHYPEKNIVLLGAKSEVEIAAKIEKELNSKVNSLVGKTNIKEAIHILNQAELFIGLDSGLLHLAVVLGKPTFSIWGPSSISLYGYERFSSMHKCVSLNLSCGPCSAWINANHDKAVSPELCPDHACIQQLMPQDVFNKFNEYLNLLPQHAS
jgi:ADP-heptose:LPS heptosyltransferase